MTDLASTPVASRPPALLRWLAGTLRIHLAGAEQLTSRGAVFVMPQREAPAGLALLTRSAERASVVRIDSTGATSAAHLDAATDALITVGEDAGEALRAAIELARQTERTLFPLGVAVHPAVGPGSGAIPLPWGRAVMVVETPFQAPPHPEHVPQAWVEAVERQIRRADGRARDILATWRRSGQLPAQG